MSRKKGVQVVFPLADDAAFQKAVEESAKFLTVIDIHQNWCGPCTIMEPIYKKFYIELDRPEERLKFFTVDVDFLSPKSREGLPITEACKPLFVLYKNKAKVAKISGAMAPELEQHITDNVPPPPQDSGE